MSRVWSRPWSRSLPWFGLVKHHWLSQVNDGEERRPAEHEAADDDADRLGGLLLAVESAQLCADLHEAASRVSLRRADQLDVVVVVVE